MAAQLENYDSGKHDEHTVAQLIFQSDPVFNTLVYGKNAIDVVERMLQLGDNFFDSRYTRCAIHEASLVGVIVGFPISEKAEIDRKSGKDFARAMGFVRMDKMMPAAEDENGYYVHTISVDPEHRGRGFGSEMIEQAASEHGALYLHVNRDNEAAIRFYERNGFKRLAEGSMKHKGRELSQVLMGRALREGHRLQQGPGRHRAARRTEAAYSTEPSTWHSRSNASSQRAGILEDKKIVNFFHR